MLLIIDLILRILAVLIFIALIYLTHEFFHYLPAILLGYDAKITDYRHTVVSGFYINSPKIHWALIMLSPIIPCSLLSATMFYIITYPDSSNIGYTTLLAFGFLFMIISSFHDIKLALLRLTDRLTEEKLYRYMEE